MEPQIKLALQILEQSSEQFNLLSLLSTVPLLDVPSLLAQHALGTVTPLGEPRVLLVTSSKDGTVRTREGDFAGFVQWDRRKCVGTDELVGLSGSMEIKIENGQHLYEFDYELAEG